MTRNSTDAVDTPTRRKGKPNGEGRPTTSTPDLSGESRDDGAADQRGWEHPRAQMVRDGELSAAQLGDHARDDDVIEPPGYIENMAPGR